MGGIMMKGLALAALTLFASAIAHAQITLDGSMGGPSGALAGPNYTIPDAVGKTVGNNLFQSFGQFNLSAGETATFTGPANIQNVISRVTGGNASSIDGLLQCDIAGANFFFINPFGVIFGQNAQVNVSGSFVVTTADYVKLGTEGRFDARNPANDILTAAPPSAFGFLGPTAAPVAITGNGASMITKMDATPLPDEKTIAIIAGDITIENAFFTVPAGRVALVSVGSAGEVVFDTENLLSLPDTSSFVTLGNIYLNNLQADTSTLGISPAGLGAGGFQVQGENVNMELCFIGAFNQSLGTILNTDITARRSIILNETLLWFDVIGADNGGDITFTAPVIRLENFAYISSTSSGDGNAGNIIFNASTSLDILSSTVAVSSSGAGSCGDIRITASAFRLDGQGNIAQLFAGNFQGTSGKPGNITIQADTMVVDNGAQINTENYSLQEGGNITIQAGSLSLTRDSFISARTLGEGPGGSINITADSVFLDRADSVVSTFGILAGTAAEGSTGRGGDIFIHTGSLQLLNGAPISSSSDTGSAGDAGDVRVEANTITLSGRDAWNVHAPSSIKSLSTGTGDAGSVIINVTGEIVVENGAAVSVSSAGGSGGNVEITAPNITIENAEVTAQAFGDGGNVLLVAPTMIYVLNGTVTAKSENGNGGNVFMDSQFTVLNNAQVTATAITGDGGNITIAGDYYFASESVVDASSEFGLQGSVSIQPPNLDLTAPLTALPTDFIDINSQLNPQCSIRLSVGESSLTVVGRGGIPGEPDGLLPAFPITRDEK
jgi:filamentous hemagglutinin family protein